MNAAELRRCRRGERCADREKTVETPRVCEPCGCHDGPGKPCTEPGGCGYLHVEQTVWLGAEIPTADGLCETCTRHVGQAITHLKGDVAELTLLIGRTGGSAAEPVSQTREPPTPLRLGVEALRAEIDDQAVLWAEIVAAQLGISWDSATARTSRMGTRVTRAVDLLVAAVGTLVALGPQEVRSWADGEPVWDDDETDAFPAVLARGERLGTRSGRVQATVEMDGIDAALHLQHLHWRAYRVAGRTKLVHRLLPRCEFCGQRQLVRHNGDEDARCESDRCRGRRVPGDRLNWLVMATTEVEKRAREESAA